MANLNAANLVFLREGLQGVGVTVKLYPNLEERVDQLI